MRFIGIIPARLASARLPNKPLAKILGIPMIGHVLFRSKMSKVLDEVFVATCDEEIAQYTRSIGGVVVMTSPNHQRASDRAAEALEKIEELNRSQIEIVVMIQGDEPMLHPSMIDAAVGPMLNDASVNVVNLMADLQTKEEHEDPNEVKVVVDRNNDALYFSREPIPSRKKGVHSVPMLKQVCIIPFRRDFLLKFSQLDPTPLEEIESVDMNRVLEHGYRVRMVKTDVRTYSVDTREDLERVVGLMRNDPLVELYSRKGAMFETR